MIKKDLIEDIKDVKRILDKSVDQFTNSYPERNLRDLEKEEEDEV